MNGEDQEGFGMYDVTIHKGERASASKYYLNPASVVKFKITSVPLDLTLSTTSLYSSNLLLGVPSSSQCCF